MADRERLLAAMRAVGPAHHEAFADRNGEDPDWSLWYADYLREEVAAALDTDLSRADLIELLVVAERAAEKREEDWPEFYVDYVLDNR